MAAPLGNQNAAKAKVWSAAIQRALAERSRIKQKEALDELAECLLAKCDEGDITALKELGDRLDGKPAQVLAGDPEQPVEARLLVRYLDAAGGLPVPAPDKG